MIRYEPAYQVRGLLFSVIAGLVTAGIVIFFAYKYYDHKQLQKAEDSRSEWAKEYIEQVTSGV